LRSTVLAGLLVLAACGPAPQSSEALPAGGEWRESQGTWTAAVIADSRESSGVRVRRGGVIFHDATGVDENVIARAPKTIIERENRSASQPRRVWRARAIAARMPCC